MRLVHVEQASSRKRFRARPGNYLEKLDCEEVLAGSTVHEVLEYGSHDRFVREVTSFSQRHMYEDGPCFDGIQDSIPLSHIEPIAALGEVHFRGKQAPHGCFLHVRRIGHAKSNRISVGNEMRRDGTHASQSGHIYRRPSSDYGECERLGVTGR